MSSQTVQSGLAGGSVPFQGTVTVTFSDAIIASTKNARVLTQGKDDPVFYIPFDDIYFDFLEKTGMRSDSAGTTTFWRVTAVGESSENFMWAYDGAGGPSFPAAHGVFDGKRARIEAVPQEDWQHTPHVVE